MFNNKSLLITGATGTFGTAFIEYLLKNYKPKRVVVFSRDELKQFIMKKTFSENKFKCLRYFIGDVRDLNRLKMATFGIDFLIHAAALKHVESSEYNPLECIKTNIHGAENVIEASLHNNVKKVIALSTDKAVNPLNFYGTTKLVSDKLFVAANNFYGKKDTRFSVVRDGNVANSRGSIIPYFNSLIKRKYKFFPVTDKNMTRFWIAKNDAVKFVINSFNRMHGGEIFVPKLKSFKIVDLCKSMDKTKNIKFIGIKPGEKIHESLADPAELSNTLEFKNFFSIIPSNNLNIPRKRYFKSKNGEIGRLAKNTLEYYSGEKKYLLNLQQLKKLISKSS